MFFQGKKRQYDQDIENLEKQQKQTIERLEQEHTTRLRDEAKRIKGEQEREFSKFQSVLKNKKKEVRLFWHNGQNISVPSTFIIVTSKFESVKLLCTYDHLQCRNFSSDDWRNCSCYGFIRLLPTFVCLTKPS